MDFLRPFNALLLFLGLAAPLAADTEIVPFKDLQTKGTPPKAIKQEVARYPSNLLRSRLEGRVQMAFVIDTEGRVRDPVVLRSNNPWFERPAIEAVLAWQFHPGELDGRKVNTQATQVIEFIMADGNGLPLWYVPKQKNLDELPPELRWEQAPWPVSTAFPVYPFAALLAGQRGKTEVKFIVAPNGRVSGSQLLSATDPEMGQAVLAMLDTWEFTPPKKKDGTPCYAALTMEHDFRPFNYGTVPTSEGAIDILKKLEKHPGEIVSLAELDRAPKPLSRRPPIYPTKLRSAGPAGQATIEFFIAPNGDAELPAIIACSAPEFGHAAAQAVATWRFEAPLKGGKPATVRVRIPIEFPALKPAAPPAK